MTKRLLLLTTAAGLVLGTAAIAQISPEPSKTEANKPAAQQTKPMSRVEKWKADQQTEAAEKPVDKNAASSPPVKPTTNAQSPTPVNGATPATNAQTPSTTTGNAANQSQSPSTTATTTLPNAGAPNVRTQQSQTSAATPAQPNAAPAQAPNAAPATQQQAQQPSNTSAEPPTTSSPAQPTASAGISITDPQRTHISQSVAKLKVQPVTKVNFSVSAGTVVPRDVRLHPVPTDVVAIVPQYRDYRFFVVREEIVIVEPSSLKIVTVLPSNSTSAASTTTSTKTPTKTTSTTTDRKSTISERDRATIKKHAVQPRPERTTTRTTERDDPRSARADARRSLRVGDRLPDSVELYNMPEPAYRQAPALREYRYLQRGSRTYEIEPRERIVIEQFN